MTDILNLIKVFIKMLELMEKSKTAKTFMYFLVCSFVFAVVWWKLPELIHALNEWQK